ncbi:MAG: branched-chain amino acid ABC transporter permease [Syntrophorhabdales bacterium]
MEVFTQTIINGLVLASIYILVALGFALIFSVMQVLNFAHGSMYMAGAYVCYYWGFALGLPPWAAIAMSAVVLALFGVFLEKFCFRFLEKNFNRTLMFALALIVVMQTAADVTVGGYVKRVPSVLPGLTTIAGITMSKERLIACVIAVFLLLAVFFLIRKTTLGRQMRAVALDRDAASLQGINAHRIAALAFGLSAGLAAVAGGLMGSIISLNTYMGDTMLVKAITLVIIAGMGSIGGLFVSGLIVGLVDAILPIFIGGAGSEVVAFGFAILILVVRPQGLFGQEI